MKDLTNQAFHKLTALYCTGTDPKGGRIWACRCSCGELTKAFARQLVSGHKKSCGCLRVDNGRALGQKRTRHGHAKHDDRNPTYITWMSMKIRCADTENKNYTHVSVCERWLIYENFLTDMGERPDGRTIGRLDNAKGYCLSNCRWETPKEQGRNRCTNRFVEHEGQRMTMAEFCETTGTDRNAARRLYAGVTV